MHNARTPLLVLRLPKHLRRYFAYPHGLFIINEKPEAFFECNIKGDYLVGDIVSRYFYGGIKILDLKTRRRIKTALDKEEHTNQLIINPPGTISQNSRTIISIAMEKFIVHGEEDLITMAISLTRHGKTIIYGYPGYGAVITISDTIKARRLLKRFKPDIVFLNKVNTKP
ncbi:MAG: DUF359 domain-containing protein [Crenarchaeota archaeon]|nr:DUF359 domain-containing protein [Thermoproteota archaeon]